jgi:predicted membrane protein
MSEHEGRDGRHTVAIILLGIAAYLILDNTGLLSLLGISQLIGWVIGMLFRLIPTAILVVGVYWLTQSRGGENSIVAWFMVLLGSVLIVSQFGLFGLSFGSLFFPMWLVIVAFVLMNPRKILPKFMNTSSDELSDDDEKIKLIAFMGGGELHYTTQTLTGGEVIAVWGGYQIDFSDAEMKGDSMELSLLCIMGGCEITVPSNWQVEKRGAVCIMGGFSNKTRYLADELELPPKKLIIKGLALMGGGEIRN